MRSKPESFEEHALRCDQRAAETERSDLKALYQDLARQWRDMANQARELQRIGFTASMTGYEGKSPLV